MRSDGLFFRAEALSSGITDGQLRRARLRGELIAVRPGAYVTAEHLSTLDSEQQHLLLARAMPEGTVLSHVSAAIAWEMDVWGLPLARVHSTSGRTITAKSNRRHTIHGTSLDVDEYVRHDGVLLTTPARTVVDIARSCGFEHAVCVGDSALRRRLLSVAELAAALESAKHRAGVPKAVRAIAAMTDRSDSVGESRSRLLLIDAGLTPLLNQSVFDADNTFLGRPDFLYYPPPLCAEFDGSGKYGQDPIAVRNSLLAEKNREDRFREVGWLFVRWGWKDLSDPGVVESRVRRGLARAGRIPRPAGSFRANPLPSCMRTSKG